MSSPETDTSELHAAITCQLEKMHVINRHLHKIWRKIKPRHQPFFSDSHLEAFGIKVSELNLRAASSRFFRPRPTPPGIAWHKLGLFSSWTGGHENEVRRITYTFTWLWGQGWLGWTRNNNRSPLKDVERGIPEIGEHCCSHPLYDWEAYFHVEHFSTDYPHFFFYLESLTVPTDDVARSEILAIVRHMLSRMKQTKYLQHSIFPILMMSTFASKVRFLQAHYNGETLYIDKSKLYDFKETSKQNYKMVLRWASSIPRGNTGSRLTTPGEALGEKDKRSVERLVRYLRNTKQQSILIKAYREAKERSAVVCSQA